MVFLLKEDGAEFPFGEEHMQCTVAAPSAKATNPEDKEHMPKHQGWESGSFEISPFNPEAAMHQNSY